MAHRTFTIKIPWLATAGAFAAFATLLVWLAFPGAGNSRSLLSNSSPVTRVAEDAWNGGPYSAFTGDGPFTFYNRKLDITKNDGFKALFVTFTATSDQHGDGVLGLSCTIDGVDCDSYGNPVLVQNNEGADWHSNSVSQSWCISLNGKNFKNPTVTLAVDAGGQAAPAPKADGGSVFFEHATVTIDGVRMTACTQGGFVDQEQRPVTH